MKQVVVSTTRKLLKARKENDVQISMYRQRKEVMAYQRIQVMNSHVQHDSIPLIGNCAHMAVYAKLQSDQGGSTAKSLTVVASGR